MVKPKERNQKWIRIILYATVAFFGLLLCSKCSPLYPTNDWLDVNCYFTVGKSWMHGIIPYRDLFEQKGPLLYLIYGIGSLLSRTSFLGIFVIEIIAFTVYLYYCDKIIRLYEKGKYAFPLILLISGFSLASISFRFGGSTEELCLPFIAIGMYHLLHYIKQNPKEMMSGKLLFLNGFFAGCIFMMKYTMLGFHFAWMLVLLLRMLSKKQYKQMIKSSLIFLGGMLSIFGIFCLYFLLVGGLKDFIDVYFIINLTTYPKGGPLLDKLQLAFRIFSRQLTTNFFLCNLIVIGLIYFIGSKRLMKEKWEKIALFTTFFFLAFSTYIGGQPWLYYFFIITFFSLFGLIAIVDIIKEKEPNTTSRTYPIVVILCIAIAFLCFTHSPNHEAIHIKKEELVQYRFARIMNQSSDNSLLNYDALDSGFFFFTDSYPTTKYFIRCNIDYTRFPDMLDDQRHAIATKKTNFVIVREGKKNQGYRTTIPYLEENYQLIADQYEKIGDDKYHYYLYERK